MVKGDYVIIIQTWILAKGRRDAISIYAKTMSPFRYRTRSTGSRCKVPTLNHKQGEGPPQLLLVTPVNNPWFTHVDTEAGETSAAWLHWPGLEPMSLGPYYVIWYKKIHTKKNFQLFDVVPVLGSGLVPHSHN